jgi:hypothetical protein
MLRMTVASLPIRYLTIPHIWWLQIQNIPLGIFRVKEIRKFIKYNKINKDKQI